MASKDAAASSSSTVQSPEINVYDLTKMVDDGDRTHGPADADTGTDKNDENEDDDDESDQWETESFYEDAIEAIGDEEYGEASREVCSVEEAVRLRKLLREVGDEEFVIQTLETGRYSARKLCTAFGVQPPSFLEGSPDVAYYRLLGICISRELSKRIKLPDFNTLDDAAALLNSSRNIVVLTGAGISTSLGIPDFRSKNTGLYSRMEHLGLTDPQEVFDIRLFREDPTIFYSIAKDILPETTRFSPTHAFIRLLQDKGKLLTNFTQNIDNLEGAAGIEPDKLIQCHGSFATATCQQCGTKVDGREIFKDIKAGKVARCVACFLRLRQMAPFKMKRKRSSSGLSSKKKGQDYEDSSDEADYEMEQTGIMKPDITFFGEDLPAKFHDRLVDHDKDKVDLVIVIGTSLKVAPVAGIPGFFPASVPQIYISRDPCSHIEFDIQLLGDCDVVVNELCKRAGWDLKHEMIPTQQRVEVAKVDNFDSRWTLKVVEPLTVDESSKDLPIRTNTTTSSNAVDVVCSGATASKPEDPAHLHDDASANALADPNLAALESKTISSTRKLETSESVEAQALAPTTTTTDSTASKQNEMLEQ